MTDIHINNCDSGEQPSGQTWDIRHWGGSEDFGDGGAGDDHLECMTCGETKPIDGWEIDYR